MISSKQWKKNGNPSVHNILTSIFILGQLNKISKGFEQWVSRQYSNNDLEYFRIDVNLWIESNGFTFKNSLSYSYISDARSQSHANIEWRNSIVTWLSARIWIIGAQSRSRAFSNNVLLELCLQSTLMKPRIF